MVKLASARDFRQYGPILSRNRLEYINAGVYVFSTVLLLGGFAAQFSSETLSGLFLLLIGFFLILIVNLHDLLAHLAGIDYRLPLIRFDLQFAFVEFAVPFAYAAGALLMLLAALFLFLEVENGGDPYLKWERASLSMFVAGPTLWTLGSILNSCQIYERSGAYVQLLQASVAVPFSMASLLFLVASILNETEHIGSHRHGLELLGENSKWICVFGSLILFVGGLANVVRVFKMQQLEGLRLEKLRGQAHEQLLLGREHHHRPLI
ncbi:hypothetical protein M569_05242, partial [Genlisea aurea]